MKIEKKDPGGKEIPFQFIKEREDKIMDVEEIREIILGILQELHEDIDFEAEEKMVDDKILDSFDLVTLVTELGEEFDVEITAKDFVAENFNSLDTLSSMIARLLDE